MKDKRKESITIEYTNREKKAYRNIVIKPTPIDDKYFIFECGPGTYYVNTDNVNVIIITDKVQCGDSL